MVSRKYNKENLTEAAQNATCMSEAMRYLGLQVSGGNHAHLRKNFNKFEIDTSHFKPNRYWGGGTKARSADEILIINPDREKTKCEMLRRALRERGRKEECELCRLGQEWQGKPLSLEIDHKNGLNWDNREENLRYLCPNCHSQTDTHGGRNKQHARVAQRQEATALEAVQC